MNVASFNSCHMKRIYFPPKTSGNNSEINNQDVKTACIDQNGGQKSCFLQLMHKKDLSEDIKHSIMTFWSHEQTSRSPGLFILFSPLHHCSFSTTHPLCSLKHMKTCLNLDAYTSSMWAHGKLRKI